MYPSLRVPTEDNNVLVEGHTATLGTQASDAHAPSDE
jgi:hypothetical protein